MPQNAVVLEKVENSKFSAESPHPSVAPETLRMSNQPLARTGAGRQNKYCTSINSYHLSKKRILPSQTGIIQNPYQSAHPSNTRLDLNIAARDNLSSFTQRVMSAKLLRLKQLQNQLSEAHLQLNELCTENRLLRSLQKRQDLALDRYEGSHAQLPQLVRSHQEEVRVLRSKYKNLKLQYRSASNTLKEREIELQNLKEQNAHLLKLSKDRQLGERETLSKKVNELKSTVDSQASTIQVLNRKVLLETKNLKFQLQQETQRHKATQLELQQTLIKMDQIQGQLEQAKERNVLPSSMDRFGNTSYSSKVPGVHKLTRRIGIEANSIQNPRDKRAAKESVMLVSANTDPSSGQPDSSPATNEFSTSLESSPEHLLHELSAGDGILSSKKISEPYKFQRGVILKGGLSKDEEVTDKNLPTSNDSHSLNANILEKEYENAVAMLNELSTQHKGSFEETMSCSFASLDLTSTKHVAALANATFAEKCEMQSSVRSTISPDEICSPQEHDLQHGDKVPQSDMKRHQVSIKRDRGFMKTVKTFSDFSVESIPKNSGDYLHKKNSETSLRSSEPSNKKNMKNDLQTLPKTNDSRQLSSTENEDYAEKIIQKADELMEVSHKEALLKALKAIDDKSTPGSDSDDSDSPIFKMSSGTVIPQRKFSGIGIGDTLRSTRRKNSFK